jgi:hypothetical protein
MFAFLLIGSRLEHEFDKPPQCSMAAFPSSVKPIFIKQPFRHVFRRDGVAPFVQLGNVGSHGIHARHDMLLEPFLAFNFREQMHRGFGITALFDVFRRG